jgi:protocatechuate 3,4-dioxygenase beta subunit
MGYDNNGYTLRGRQFTDANGYYRLTTVIRGFIQAARNTFTLKFQAPNGKPITSQLFFPGMAGDDTDRVFDLGLLLAIQESSDEQQGQFNFIVPAP